MMGKRILIVDDNLHFCKTLRDYLDSEGFAVDVCHNGHMALQKLFEEDFNLVILDIMMPKMDGWAACEAIMGDPELKEIPIIISSIKASSQDKNLALEVGVCEYMVKPYRYPDMLQTINRLLQSNN